MTPATNPLLLNIKPKQKKDLLGIYQDYLYFSRGMEVLLNQYTPQKIIGMFIERVGWKRGQNMPWGFEFTSKTEYDDYTKFVTGNITNPKQYTYISLYHTDKEQDVSLPKISSNPETYEYSAIDLNLPCLVERYGIACPKGQKLKDATFLVDGVFKAQYTGEKFADTPVFDALADSSLQKEFRVLLMLVDYCNKKKFELLRNHNFHKELGPVLNKIIISETMADFENKVLDLLGSCADKTYEILREVYAYKDPEKIWQKAEQSGLILSAENMKHYLNIRNLIRHQWDSLDNTGRFSFGINPQNEKLRNEYLKSYQLFFSHQSLIERIKEYQNVTRQFQPLLATLYPEFIVREHGETNSKFITRIKLWQQQNPDKIPMINGNYPLNSDKHNSLCRNLQKIFPEAQLLDDMSEAAFANSTDMEAAYFKRTAYLRVYSRIVSNFVLYSLTNGVKVPPKEMLENLKQQNAFTPAEYNRWQKYRLLRNNLSHNHLNLQLREELDTVLADSFVEDCNKLQDYLINNSQKMIHVKDSVFTAIQKDGSVIHLDLSNNTILAHTDKNGNNLQQNTVPSAPKKRLPLKINTWNKEVIDCRFDNGITINLSRKKISFPDGTRIYCDAENYNAFHFDNGNKIFTDKTFVVTKYMERGHYASLDRSAMFMIAPKHKIRTDSRSRLVESSLICENNQKLVTKLNYDSNGAIITLPDGTKINTTNTGFTVSHNNIKLSYETIGAFARSYRNDEPLTPPPFSR